MTFENTHQHSTRWSVITGAPCSGKTAVIRMLEQRGHKVIHEVARAYIDNELMKGKALTEIKTDEWSFERHILMEKVRIEARLKKDEIIFFDRGVPDSIAYYKLNGLNTAEPFQDSDPVVTWTEYGQKGHTGVGAATAVQYAAIDPRCRGVVAAAPYADLRSVAKSHVPLMSKKSFVAERMMVGFGRRRPR